MCCPSVSWVKELQICVSHLHSVYERCIRILLSIIIYLEPLVTNKPEKVRLKTNCFCTGIMHVDQLCTTDRLLVPVTMITRGISDPMLCCFTMISAIFPAGPCFVL